MSELFLTVLNMSLTSSYVILFVILVRLLLKKAPKVISYVLWGVVAFRLIIPFSFESIFSLMPWNTNTMPISHDIIYKQSPQINSGIETVDSFVSQSLPAPIAGASVNPLQIYMEIGTYIWLIGTIALLVYSFVSIMILKKQLESAQLIEQNIFQAKNLKTPFVLGLIKPKIYVPVGLNATERSYILLHEQTHIHRKDHIIKVLAFLILSIHWFNLLVWIAFILMSKDMELSCDERVLKEMGEDIKKPYANSLLSLATGRHILNGSPLTFGEGNVRGRIKNVLNYKRPKFWVIIFTIAIITIVGVGLIANPIEREQDLSMLNIKNLAKISYQRDELLVSRAPGKNDGFNVSARAIAEYLDNVKWTEKKMDSPLELAATLKIEWNEEQELLLYESDAISMVRIGEQWRCYKIGENDYETLISIIETASTPQSISFEEKTVDFGAYPQDYSPEQGVKDGFFVVVHGEVKGGSQSLLNGFMQAVENKEPAYLKILQYTIEGDPLFVELIYDGSNAPITANFDSTRDKFGTQTTTTSMQVKYIKLFEQDGIVRIYLTDKYDLTLEEALGGSSECLNIVTFASMTLSHNDLFPINGEHQYLMLKMVRGKFYEDWSPGAYMGTIWEGDFIIELVDESGNDISRTDLKNIYKEPLIFNSTFQIQFDDYNNDGDLDFTIGQYASSNGRNYKLFTLRKDGKVEELPIKGHSSLFISDTTGFYSTKLTKIDNVTFKIEYYDNSKSKNIEKVFKWDGKRFINN